LKFKFSLIVHIGVKDGIFEKKLCSQNELNVLQTFNAISFVSQYVANKMHQNEV